MPTNSPPQSSADAAPQMPPPGGALPVAGAPSEPWLFGEHEPRRFWVGRGGHCVVSNQPARRLIVPREIAADLEALANLISSHVLDVASELHYYGGFIVCESCAGGDAETIADALNFAQGVPPSILRRPFTRYLPTHNWTE